MFIHDNHAFIHEKYAYIWDIGLIIYFAIDMIY